MGGAVCVCATSAGTYADPTAAADTFSTTVASPTVASLTTTTAASGATTALAFVTTNLVDDATRPYFKIVANGVACNAADGAGDAIGTWAAGQLVYGSATGATFDLVVPVGFAAVTNGAVCVCATSAGTYADPTAAADAFSTTLTAPTVASLTTTTAASGATTTFNFVTTNLVNDATR